jgi:hypothetical protein
VYVVLYPFLCCSVHVAILCELLAYLCCRVCRVCLILVMWCVGDRGGEGCVGVILVYLIMWACFYYKIKYGVK